VIRGCIIRKARRAVRSRNFDSRTLYRRSFKRAAQVPPPLAEVLEKRVFWDDRIVSDSLPGSSGESRREAGTAEERRKGGARGRNTGRSRKRRKWRKKGALGKGGKRTWKRRKRRAPSYRLMVCSRIGLVDRRLNWVSVQSPANTSSTDSPVRARG